MPAIDQPGLPPISKVLQSPPGKSRWSYDCCLFPTFPEHFYCHCLNPGSSSVKEPNRDALNIQPISSLQPPEKQVLSSLSQELREVELLTQGLTAKNQQHRIHTLLSKFMFIPLLHNPYSAVLKPDLNGNMRLHVLPHLILAKLSFKNNQVKQLQSGHQIIFLYKL